MLVWFWNYSHDYLLLLIVIIFTIIIIIIIIFALGHLEIEKSAGARQGGNPVTWYVDKYEYVI